MNVQIQRTRWFGLCVMSGLMLAAAGCSTNSDPPSGGAGTTGSSTGSGGTAGSSSGSGGTTSGPGTGGSGGAGGSTVGGTGGSATGGGGGAGTGGSTTGGSSGAGTAGTGGSGTADAGSKDATITDSRPDVPVSDVMPPPSDATSSTGCNAAMWPASGTFNIDVGGTMRTYIVKIPAAYDTKKPYKLIFTWHGLGGTAQQIAQFGYYGLETLSAGSAIFVSGQGLDTGNDAGAGWPNTNGQDVNFVKGLVDWMKNNYCVDETRIFSVGMSYGGIMSNTLGCQMGNVFRAITPMSGSGPFSFGTSACTGQHVAAWLSHGTQDPTVAFDAGVGSREHWRAANHCAATSVATTPTGCISYDGCDPGYPVHWCAFDGGHVVPSFAPQGIWNFLSMF